MLRKLKFLTILCVILCLLTACGRPGNTQAPGETTPAYVYSASAECWVYIEFDSSYVAEQIRMNLTTADGKDVGKEIHLTYDPSISGCIFPLEGGSYCLSMVYSGEQGSSEQVRYFVVGEEHSYYHILFTP